MEGKLVMVLFVVAGYVSAGMTSVVPLKIISRSDWGARRPTLPPTALDVEPPNYVVIHHSATRSCTNEKSCARLVKAFQNYHMDNNEWNDIGYNFVIGEDGNIYEGRGWGITGAHAPGFNSRSIGICVTGTFTDHLPNEAAMRAIKNLISYGVYTKNITPGYNLIGHRQASATLCPGKKFFEEIETWNHWTPNPEKLEE